MGSEGPFYTKGETNTLLNAKQNTINSSHKLSSDLVDDTGHTNKFVTANDKLTWNGKYTKPNDGIPKTDLSNSVQASLDNADTAIQDMSDKEDKSNKVTSISSTSTDTQYPSAKCVYDSQTTQNNEIDTLKMIYNILPTTSDEDTSITLDGTGEMPFKSIDLKGNTYQYTTTGKNLFNASYYKDQTVYNKTVAIETGNVSCVKLNLKPNTTYTISEALNNWTLTGAFLFAVINANNQIIRYLQTKPQDYQTNPTTFTTNSEGYVYIGHRYGFSSSDRMITFLNTVNIQIEEGNTATSFEEYTNGASPNPDYPQEVEVVTGNNSIKVEGKNLFDKSTITNIINGTIANNIVTSNSISISFGGVSANVSGTILSAGTYYLSLKAKIDSGSTSGVSKLLIVGVSDNEITVIEKPTISSSYQTYIIKIAISETKTITNIGVQLGYTNTNAVISFTDIMISKSSDSTYEPYTSQIYPINLGSIELCKIGDYVDYIEKNTGKNLFDSEYANNSSIYTITIEAENPLGTVNCYELQLKPNTTYTLSVDMNGYTKAYSWLAGLCYADGTFIALLQYGTMDNITTQTFTTDNTGKIYIGERYGIGTNDRMPLFLQTALIQIEENNTATKYEPYGTDWYKYSAIGKVVLDGSENWSFDSTTTNYYEYKITNLNAGYGNSSTAISNYFNQTGYSRIVITGSGTLYLRYPTAIGIDVSTVSLFKTWLSNNNTIVYYVLATPTYTKITDSTLVSQLNNLEKSISYDTQTNISQTNNDLSFKLDVKALRDISELNPNELATKTEVSAKQDTLIAGSNISIASDGKTISATDTTYSDATTTTAGLMSSTDKTKLDGIDTGAEVNVQADWNEANTSSDAYIQNKPSIPKYYYGTCSTKNSTRAKVVECPNFVLEEGATISVLFTNAQTYNGAPQLNVNGTGAVTVQYKSGTSGIRYMWNSGAVIDFTYNGTYWVMHRSDLATTTYYGLTKYSESIASTSAGYSLTPSAMNKAMLNIISGTPVYSSSATYEVGNKVRYADNVWRCTTAIETAEAWDESHWEVVDTLQDQIDNKQDNLVSGTNIKTVNNNSLVGSGNVSVGTITEITMNGSSKGTSGVVDLGTVITSHQDISGKQNIEDNSLETVHKTIPSAINEVNDIAKGANQSVGYANYSTMVTALNSMDDDEFTMGQNIYIVTVNVPDLWVSSVESTSSTYTYVDDATIVNALETNGYIQVGYYKLSMLETQKVDLTNYVTTTDYATSSVGGVVRVYSSDGFAMNNGVLIGSTKTYQQYNDGGNWMMLCKGTLENVITGKGLGTYSKPSGGIPSTDLDSTVQTSLDKADGSVQLNGGSAVQTISLTSGTGTTALGLKSMSSASSYISFSSTGGWLGSYGVSSTKKPVFYNGVGYTLATTDDVPKVVTLSQSDYDDLVSGGTVDADTYYFIEE